jgi:hypothetical protein
MVLSGCKPHIATAERSDLLRLHALDSMQEMSIRAIRNPFTGSHLSCIYGSNAKNRHVVSLERALRSNSTVIADEATQLPAVGPVKSQRGEMPVTRARVDERCPPPAVFSMRMSNVVSSRPRKALLLCTIGASPNE